MEYQAITVRLPLNIYERLRTEAFEERTSQVGIIIEALSERYSIAVGDEGDGNGTQG